MWSDSVLINIKQKLKYLTIKAQFYLSILHDQSFLSGQLQLSTVMNSFVQVLSTTPKVSVDQTF